MLIVCKLLSCVMLNNSKKQKQKIKQSKAKNKTKTNKNKKISVLTYRKF